MGMGLESDMDPKAVITARGLGHWFGQGEGRRQVLFDIDLSLRPGMLTVLVGASGSGKTTLLTLLGCLRRVQAGRATLLGTALDGATEATLTACRRRLGFIFQAHNLHDSLTAVQNVCMGFAGGTPGPHQADRARDLLETLGLAQRADHLPAQLSGGQKQRVAIARALVRDPAVVFADEPTAALDRDSAAAVVRLLRDRAVGGTTIIMVTHDSRIMDQADQILTMEDGRLVLDAGR
ncbi:MAG: hypothetical protein RLY86_1889 [Pseudomonadota bacterium]